MEIAGAGIGWTLIALYIWLVIDTLIRIRKEIGFWSLHGFLWMVFAITNGPITAFLFRRYRDKTEDIIESLFKRR